MKEAVEENFPDLRLELLSTTQLSTEMLLDTLRSYKSNTGIIYYSWFESHNENDNNYLFDHIQEIITNFTPSPLFLLSHEDLSNNTLRVDTMSRQNLSAILCWRFLIGY